MSTNAVGLFPVDPESGDFWHTFTDISVKGYGPGLELSRTYNSSNAAVNSAFGWGWTMPYTNYNTSTCTITLPDGSTLSATNCGSGYTLPAWSDSTLSYSGGVYDFNYQRTLNYYYNSSGVLQYIEDLNGARTTFSYTSGNLTTITDPSGRTITLTYNANNLVASATDPLGRVWHYYYTAFGAGYDLSSVSDPRGEVTSFQYNPANLMSRMTLPNGQSGGPSAGTYVSNTYNMYNEITSQTDQMGNVTTYGYTGNYAGNNLTSTGGTTIVTDPDGNETAYKYVNGTLTSKVLAYGTSSAATWTYTVDSTTLGTKKVTDPNSNATNYTYDADGNVLTKTNALGNVWSYSYNAFDEQTCAAQPLATSPCSSLSPPAAIVAGSATITPPSSAPPAYVTYSQYDTHGNLIYTTTGDYSPTGTLTQQRTSYDLYNGQLVTLGTTTDGCTASAPSTELPCATINPDGAVTQLTYNFYGDVISRSIQLTPDHYTVGVINTVAGAPLGPVTASTQSQSASQVATATVGGVPYLYVADPANNVVHRIDVTTDVETVVAGTYASGYYGDGYPATQAQLNAPDGVAVDLAGDIAIADSSNNVVRFVPASSGTYFGQSMTGGDMYTVAGNGSAGFSGDGGPSTSGELDTPQAVAFDGNSIVIADTYNNAVRFIPASSGTYFGQSMIANDIYTVAGNATAGYSGDGGSATSAELHDPEGVAIDASGDILIGDSANNVVRMVAATSATNFGQSMIANDIYTVAGNTTAGYSGDGGSATSAELRWPAGVWLDAAGDLLIADNNNHSVRMVAATSATNFGQSMSANDIYTVAGHDSLGNSGNGALATSAAMDGVNGVAMDPSGNLYVADVSNDTVRVVAASTGSLAGQGVTADDIYNVAGSGPNTATQFAGQATDGQLSSPEAVCIDGWNNTLIVDAGNNAIRYIPSMSGTYFGQSMTAGDIYTIAGNGTAGYSGDGGPATSAELNHPEGCAVDMYGDVAIADTNNDVIRLIAAYNWPRYGLSMTAGDIYTIAGNGTAGFNGDGGASTSAELNHPKSVAFDNIPNLFIADTGNDVIRFLPLNTGTNYGQSMTVGDIYTIAGNGTAGYSGDGGAATSATLNGPRSISIDGSADILIADTANNAVRYMPNQSGSYFGQSMTAGDIYTIAGNGTAGYSGDGGAATSAEISSPLDATFYYPSEGLGFGVLITDAGNDVVRCLPSGTGTQLGQSMIAGDIYTIAGAGWTDYHFGGDGGAPLNAQFGWLTSATPDGLGGYYITDAVDQRVRHVTRSYVPATNATTTYGYDADGELASMTTPDGNVSGANAANYTTTYVYNADGEVTSRTQAGGTGSTVTPRITAYTYDGDGNNTSVTDARGYTTSTTFNANDEASVVTNPLGDASLTCYDGDGNVAQTVPAIGVAANSLSAASCPTSYPSSYGVRLATDATTTSYNAMNEKLVVTSPAPAGLTGYETTTYAYDLGGRPTSVSAPATSNTVGAPNDVTTYTYDAAGDQLTSTIGAGTASAATTSFCFDPNGDKTAEVAADGNVSALATCSMSAPYQTSSSYQTGYQYDSLGELVTQDAPATSAAPSGEITTYTYDPAGNQLTSTNPNGVTATSTYTPLNQRASVSYSDGTHSVQYSYDASGNMTGMVDASGTTTNVYDPFNGVTSSTDGAGKTTSYSYDVDGNTTGITYPLGSGASWASSDTVSYTYDHADQLASVTDFNGHTSNVTRTADGAGSALSLGASGDTISTSYAANDAPLSITLGNGSTLQSFTYSDVPSGGVASETDTPSSSLSPASYTYNAQSQVTKDTPGSGTATSYSLDASGNLTTLPTGASATYNAASEVTSSTLSGSTTSYTYDASGNRTGESVGGSATVTATYNGANQLTSYNDSSVSETGVTYNGLGLRTAVTVTPSGGSPSTQSYVWNPNSSVPVLLQDSSNAYIYGTSGTPFEQVNLSSGTIVYLVTDALGSVRGVVDAAGTLSATASYDAWGNAQTSGGVSADTPFGFSGGYFDSTGLYYLINRNYDPSTGQFTGVDPLVGETWQPYVYANDNPVNLRDPLGLKIAGTGSAACNIQQIGHSVGLIDCNGRTAGQQNSVGKNADSTSTATLIFDTPPIVYNYSPIGIVTVQTSVSVQGTSNVSVGKDGFTVTSGINSATIGFDGKASGSLGLPAGGNIAINDGAMTQTGPQVESKFGNDTVTAQTTVSFYPESQIPPPLTAVAVASGVGVGVWSVSPGIAWTARLLWSTIKDVPTDPVPVP